jgi:hypothetical protein
LALSAQDFATGAAYKFSDDTLSVNMTPLPQVATVPKTVPVALQVQPPPQENVAPHPAIKEPSNPQQRPIQTDNWEKQ